MIRATALLLVLSLVAGGSPPLESPAATEARANYLITVTDDFVVDVYLNGKPIADAQRQLLDERFGATAEQMNVAVKKGDWLVFNVVNNRLRWNGAKYFA